MRSIRTGKRQCGVIPVRFAPSGELEVLLITSRGTGRWVVPKGWPMKGRSAAEAAEIEAYEEAGLQGRTARKKIGSYDYRKVEPSGAARTLKVDVFLMMVDTLLEEWPEQEQRRRMWFSPGEGAAQVAEHDLARLLKRLSRFLAKSRQFNGSLGDGAGLRLLRGFALFLVVAALASCSYGGPDTPGSITTHAGGRVGVYGAMSTGR